jgi:hypothetical protein
LDRREEHDEQSGSNRAVASHVSGVAHVWKTQGSILDGMQDFAEGWFQRRHVGVQAAHEACKRMCGANTPIEWFHEYQMWIGGAFQRLMADSLVLQQGLKKITDKVSPTLVPTINREQGDVTEVADKGRVHMT